MKVYLLERFRKNKIDILSVSTNLKKSMIEALKFIKKNNSLSIELNEYDENVDIENRKGKGRNIWKNLSDDRWIIDQEYEFIP